MPLTEQSINIIIVIKLLLMPSDKYSRENHKPLHVTAYQTAQQLPQQTR